MLIFQQRRISIILLALYWPVLIFFAHMPVPDSVRGAHVSDKSLHFQAYLVLAFLVWFSIKPHEKVNWRKFPVWLVLLGLTAYGGIDEVIQGHIGRSCDMMDLVTNILGITACLFLLTYISFLPAAMLICGFVILGIANVSKSDLSELFPLAYGVFHFFAYSIFTTIWILNIDLLFTKKLEKAKWFAIATGMPICFLLIVRLFSSLLGNSANLENFVIPVIAIILVTAARYLQTKSLIRSTKLN